MKHEFNKDTWKVGQTVWSVIDGKGHIIEIDSAEEYPICVKFEDCGDVAEYDYSGRGFNKDKNPTIYPFGQLASKKRR